MQKHKFIVEGKAVAKARPRIGRGGFVFTPSSTINYEERVSQAAIDYNIPKFNCPICVSIKIYYKVPKSKSKAETKLCLSNTIRPQKNDLDNIIKSILDGMQKGSVVFDNDNIVHRIEAERFYGETEYAEVEIWKL